MKKFLLCYLLSLIAIVCQAADVEINSLSDLQTLRDNVNDGTNTYSGMTVSLNCDLKLNDWTPIGLVDDNTHTFQGTFEGNGHTVIINVNTSEAVAGFFGYLRGTVQHLKVVGSVLCTNTTTSAAGGIAGYNHGGTISQCANLATVIGYICGGITGETEGGTICNCYNTGYIGSYNNSATHLAGIAGKNNGGTIDHVFASCIVEAVGNYKAITASGSATNAFYNVKTTHNGATLDGSEALTGTALQARLNTSGVYTIWEFTYGLPELVEMSNKPVYLMNDTHNTTFLDTYQSQTRTVQLMDRTLQANNWNSLCLPFNLTAEQITSSFGAGTRVMTLSGYSNDGTTVTITFADAATMEAGKPYIVKPTMANSVFTGVTIDKTMHYVTAGGATFKGTYEPVNLTANDTKKLFLANNMLWYPTADLTVNSCRAYFDLEDEVPTDDNHAARLVICFGKTTGVTSMEDGIRQMEDAWYNMQGRKFSGKPTTKGFYIHNGKKEVMK
ncbi:hypothetical protein [Prevotella sp. E13-27]|uniref:hypothetical protein n=1 Tax=Prevotella sp. E13-27 TaxID=2938122 RepID=UPI00200A6285|nr:hypothetical protein [Prevotella sp. E13-27]MCK8621094.1 hypothetical protein [Prevotella sp. E13-27]